MELKQRILEETDALFNRFGIKSVTMDDIAKELGISKKTLYQYVSNKQDLIEQIYEKYVEEEKEMMDRIRQDAADAIDEILKMAKYVLKQLRCLSSSAIYDLQKYYGETWRKMEALHQRYNFRLIRDNMIAGKEQGLYRDQIDPDILARLYVAKMSTVADESLFPLSEYRLEDLFRQHIIYHIRGIASARGFEVLETHIYQNLDTIEDE